MKTPAYIVLAHAQPVQFQRLVAALRDHGAIHAHIDARSDAALFRQPGVMMLDQRVKVRWGGFSIIEATIHLLHAALRSGKHFSHVVLLSGDSYPLASPSAIARFLAGSDRNYINLVPMPAPAVGKPIERLTRFYLEQTPRKSKVPGAWHLVNSRIHRDFRPSFGGMDPHGGSQWWALTRDAAKWILEEIDRRPEYVRFCRHTSIPDEHFFHTLLASSPFRHSLEPSLVYADFSGPIAPAIINEAHVRSLLEAPEGRVADVYGHRRILFVRKLTDESDEVASLIRSQW